MSKPTSGHRAPHFLPVVCEHACTCLLNAYQSIEGGDLVRNGPPNFRAGPHPSAVLAHAWKLFESGFIEDGRLIPQPDRECDEKSFRRILDVHWAKFKEHRTCPRPTRGHGINLTEAETRELAELVSIPRLEDDGQYHRYSTLDRLALHSTRAAQLIGKAHATPKTLHDHLMATVPGLRYTLEDVVAALPKRTSLKRKYCAGVLRGESDWFKRPKMHGTRDVSTACSVDGGDNLVSVKWNQEWWLQHTFMIDATHVTNVHAPEDDVVKVYSMEGQSYPPREVKTGPTSTSSTKSISLMFYAVFHAYLGCVVGPDLVWTGCRTPKKGAADRHARFLDAHLQSWYATDF